MDAVTVVEPLIDEAAPVVAEQAVKILYATGNIIVVETQTLKIAGYYTALAVVGGVSGYLTWKRNIQPLLQAHKERKRFEELAKKRAAEREKKPKAV